MTLHDLTRNTFKALHHELGHDRQHDTRPMWQRRLSSRSLFCRALVGCGYLTEAQMQRAAGRYRLGMSRDGGVIFWQIDQHDTIRDGKIMYYGADCHRDHHRHPTWVNYLLKRAGMLLDDFQTDHCLFGLHLLADSLPAAAAAPVAPPSASCAGPAASAQPAVCVVESEKTAVIMSEVEPHCLWLATGGKTELSVAKLMPLAGRRVIVFPDTDTTGDTYRLWYDVAREAGDVMGQPVTVSSILELQATAAQKAAKIDIVDLLFPSPTAAAPSPTVAVPQPSETVK